ncbi:MAG: NAD-dependent epimerase/dehydratase family protein [Pseudomonadota bacterium]
MLVLVTGSGGFLGRALVRRLLARGYEVRGLTRSDCPDLKKMGVDARRGDIADPRAVFQALKGCDLVFHTAAKAGVWGNRDEYQAINVKGTENVISACRAHGVGRLVYTSSPSVVFSGGNMEGVDESVPYSKAFMAHYPRTKALAEKMVLQADSRDLAVAALRPHLIWGPGDPHFVPRLCRRAKAGRLAGIRGGPRLVDSIYIDNAADAHIRVADRLKPGAPPAGRAYFISQDQPMDIVALMNGIIGAAGLPPIGKFVSPLTAQAAGWMLESVYSLLGIKTEPPMTRFVAAQLSHSHWFDISAAKHDFGYTPAVSIAAGFERLAAWLAEGGGSLD